jgi:hypothetical protein
MILKVVCTSQISLELLVVFGNLKVQRVNAFLITKRVPLIALLAVGIATSADRL